ncbi:MAG: UDP-N-acetylmuramoylalanine--D-glutamate ligase [Gaiellaceae bacterium]|jgi:UDP-N-acetylmuramoylalanine--D-glutamate ligase|nr:UDP-N-acetylmuramoylalanine--D-glutamate ligase [Gaiellaceae bacterium]MDX6471496.1 UDP-N-acetylmuramoylalanine--D-glutamate ligase [Gaiellaceae bacterium]
MDDWLPRRALVLGLARSGRASALALARRGVEVVAADRSESADPGRLAGAGVEVRLGIEEESLLQGVELVVKSPGVPGESPLVAGARARGLPVWSEVELGYRLLAGNPFIGVTGTNGKTTTTELIAAILRAAGRPVEVAGNVGIALTEVAEQIEPGTSVVCELSSFQLEDVDSLACDVAVLLNLEPDHLDRHGTFEAYRDAKLRIFERARTKVVPRGSGLEGIEFAADDPLPAEPLIPGLHNRENAAAATAAARAAGVGDEAIAEALRTFAGVPHRLELVRELRGVRYVNDSKATNAAAARRGVAAYGDAGLRLILGGSTKGEDFDEFARGLPGTVRSIYLIGESADDLAAALDGAGRAYVRAGELGRAVELAAAAAEPGDVVLLSPASASYDQFDNFEHRGAVFRRLVEELA